MIRLSGFSATFAFYATTLTTAILFLRLARQWPCLALSWEKLEREFTSRHRRVSRTTLATRFKIVTAVVMSVALGGRSLSNEHDYVNVSLVSRLNHFDDLV